MVISRQCSVVGCDEYARLTRKYVAKNKINAKQGGTKEDIINIDLCYRHRFVEFDKVKMIGEFERTPGNITKKEHEKDADGPITKIELEYDENGVGPNAKILRDN